MFFVVAVSAWFLNAYPILNTRDKRRKSIAILILVIISFALLILLSAVFSVSIAFTVSLEEVSFCSLYKNLK